MHEQIAGEQAQRLAPACRRRRGRTHRRPAARCGGWRAARTRAASGPPPSGGVRWRPAQRGRTALAAVLELGAIPPSSTGTSLKWRPDLCLTISPTCSPSSGSSSISTHSKMPRSSSAIWIGSSADLADGAVVERDLGEQLAHARPSLWVAWADGLTSVRLRAQPYTLVQAASLGSKSLGCTPLSVSSHGLPPTSSSTSLAVSMTRSTLSSSGGAAEIHRAVGVLLHRELCPSACRAARSARRQSASGIPA